MSGSPVDDSVVTFKSEHRGEGGNNHRDGNELFDRAAAEFASQYCLSHSISSFRVVTGSFSFGFLISLTEMLPRSFPRHSSRILVTASYRSTQLLLHATF